MTLLTLIAGICGLVEGIAGLIGALFIYLCVDYPRLLISNDLAIHLRRILQNGLAHDMNITNGSKLDLHPVTIMASGYSSDPDREIIFCFSVLSSTFGSIWVLASVLIFIGSWLKNSRLLWLWVLSTMSVAFLDFVGAIFFANKTGGYILFFEDTQESILSDSTMSFLKYKYPIILLIVFGRGIVTVPINMFLAMFVHRTAQHYYSAERKECLGLAEQLLEERKDDFQPNRSIKGFIFPWKVRMVVPQLVVAHSPTFAYPVRNGLVEAAPSNGSSSSAVYTNESFTSDEKY